MDAEVEIAGLSVDDDGVGRIISGSVVGLDGGTGVDGIRDVDEETALDGVAAVVVIGAEEPTIFPSFDPDDAPSTFISVSMSTLAGTDSDRESGPPAGSRATSVGALPFVCDWLLSPMSMVSSGLTTGKLSGMMNTFLRLALFLVAS